MEATHFFQQFQTTILSWYDDNRRTFVWRHSTSCQPYKVWLSEMMLQQTTTSAVTSYYKNFLKLWPTVEDLAKADLDAVLHAWQGLGYYARARNLHRCAQEIVEKFQGIFPNNEAELIKLPGIGPYSAAAIAAIAFNTPAVVLDTNIIRIITRIFAIQELIKPQALGFKIVKEKAELLMSHTRPGDYAQALMDLGATVCTAKTPRCLLCPVQQFCQAFSLGVQEKLPVKAPPPNRPIRRMIFWVLVNKSQEIAFVKRPPKGLLGGLMSLPLSLWNPQENPEPPFPFSALWQELPAIQHVFTHFIAHVSLYKTEAVAEHVFPADCWCSLTNVHTLALPTIVKKALKKL